MFKYLKNKNLNMKFITNNKVLLLLTTLFCLTLINGCDFRSESGDEPTGNVYSGYDGINLEFMNNLPPRRIYDTASLTIVSELENLGTKDIAKEDCVLHLHGFDPSTFIGLKKTQYCGAMQGKSIEYPRGEISNVEFSTDTIELIQGVESFPQNFVLTACYDYETIATPVVCIDPQYDRIDRRDSACTLRDVSLSGGQGAPVSVSNVGVNMIGRDKVAFEINIKNSGDGNILRSGIDLFNSCPGYLNYNDYDIVEYDIKLRNANKIKCSPELEGGSRVRLNNGNAKIICTFEVAQDSAYTTPLNIWLGYSYMNSESKTVEVIKTP